MADDEIIERCALICDVMIGELEILRRTARKSHYDRRSQREIDYAIRAVRRAAERIRVLKGVAEEPGGPAR